MASDTLPQNHLSESRNKRTTPSRLLTNFYLLLGIGILVLSGRIAEGTLTQYMVGSIAEILLVFIAIGCIKLNKLPIRRTMRLKWPGLESIFLSLIAAPGLWMMGVAFNVITTLVFGYTTPTPPQMYPTTIWESVGLAVTAMIVAPICEELMFRGYVQRAYDRGKPVMGIVIGGLLFALYHMQFQGLFALIPVAITLGFVAWRTDSVLPGMVLHAGYNTFATIILVSTTFLPYQIATALLIIFILIGILGVGVTVISLWLLWRKTSPNALPQPKKSTGLVRWAWVIPLVLFAMIYIYGSVSEVIAGKFPELIATGTLDLRPPSEWREQLTWEYDIQDILGTQLGSAECTLDPAEKTFKLGCSGDYQSSSLFERIPLELPWLSEKFSIEATNWEREVVWNNDNLHIVEFSSIDQASDHQIKLYLDNVNQTLTVESADNTVNEINIPSNSLVFGEWPWRLAGLPLDLFYGGTVPLIIVSETGDLQLFDAFVSVRSAEPTWTPSSSLITWKVTVSYTDDTGDDVTETAWYDTAPPHPLIRYDNGQVIYVMSSLPKSGYVK